MKAISRFGLSKHVILFFLAAPACEKAWIYERVPGYELAGYNDLTIPSVVSRLDCQELCLRDRALPCRSAEYNYETRTCVLSRETRRTQPAAYRYAKLQGTKA